ncbi:MAG: hypothetical protein EBR34_16320 [Sphingomonadaceae bacterium]|nr:hypothetical protein [Sphingomonadaceae bacterium]
MYYICIMEKFKNIKGYENMYQAGNKGNIKSLITNRILKASKDKCNYKIVTLCKDGKHSTKTVHRLVAITWFGESKLDVNHKDGNKGNNALENLEFITKSENTRHALKNGLFKPNFDYIAIRTRKKVKQLNPKTNEVINIFESAHEASRQTGFNRGNICSCCRGEVNLVQNYKWQYEY